MTSRLQLGGAALREFALRAIRSTTTLPRHQRTSLLPGQTPGAQMSVKPANNLIAATARHIDGEVAKLY